jgi:hypothetical protein
MSKCKDSYDTVCPPSICDCRTKTLTDEEILDASTLGDPDVEILYLSSEVKEKIIQRGRAVLRKAQEK